MSKEIKTPEYWKDEFFQPLVAAKTINGNEVMIPKMLMRGWHSIEIQGKTLLEIMPIEEICPDISPERMSFRRIMTRDYRKVFFEVWKENSPIETQIVEHFLQYCKEKSKLQ